MPRCNRLVDIFSYLKLFNIDYLVMGLKGEGELSRERGLNTEVTVRTIVENSL